MSPRTEAVTVIADWIDGLELDHPTRVAVDGITAAGKTTLAQELTDALVATGRRSVHLSTDDYHHQSERRHRQGRLSADGYYDDAYDLDAFRSKVLEPLGPSGSLRYRPRHHDLETDDLLDDEPVEAAARDVFVVDGSFLQRPELHGHWDVVVWVETGFEVAVSRAVERDAALFGGAAQTREAYAKRYHAAARRYLREVDPTLGADVIFGNDDIDRPYLRWQR